MPTLPNICPEPRRSLWSPYIPTRDSNGQASAFPAGLRMKRQLLALPEQTHKRYLWHRKPNPRTRENACKIQREEQAATTARVSDWFGKCREEQWNSLSKRQLQKAEKPMRAKSKLTDLRLPPLKQPCQPRTITLIKVKVWTELIQLCQQNLFTLSWDKNYFFQFSL